MPYQALDNEEDEGLLRNESDFKPDDAHSENIQQDELPDEVHEKLSFDDKRDILAFWLLGLCNNFGKLPQSASEYNISLLCRLRNHVVWSTRHAAKV